MIDRFDMPVTPVEPFYHEPAVSTEAAQEALGNLIRIARQYMAIRSQETAADTAFEVALEAAESFADAPGY